MARKQARRSPFGFAVPDVPASLDDVFNLHDFESLARERLAPTAYGYYASGAGDERSLADNLASWSRWRLVPRVLAGARHPELTTSLLGASAALPIGVAPAALQGMAHPDGELALARAAARAGAPFVLSTASTRSIEEVGAAAGDTGAPRWFQLYVEHDLAFARELVERAEAAGFGAVVLTVDLPVAGYRERDLRTRFSIPASVQAHLPPDAAGGDDTFVAYLDRKPPLRWQDVATIAGWTSLPLVLKGILSPLDVDRAIQHGARAIWVSNHGGRQLDGTVTAPEVLGEIVDATEGRAEVYADGGVRRGSDVAVALVLGARAVFTARPFLYALAAAGEAGADRAFEIIGDELRRALAILGVVDVAGVRRDHIRPAP